jgi:hypothetical protein
MNWFEVIAMNQAACILVAILAAVGCDGRPTKDGPRLTEAEAVGAALPAMKADMPPEYVDKYRPYRAELADGVWTVSGTAPGGGPGGTPAAHVRDRDGKVLGVFHTQ